MIVPTLLTLLQAGDPLAVVDDAIRGDHDILHYHVAVSIPDRGTMVRGATTVRYVVRGGAGPVTLDFDDVFTIDSIVWPGGPPVAGAVRDGRLAVDRWGAVGDTLAFTVFYRGRPADGLFIQENVHGERTAFADNWPNRARHWFPSEDHPSDKATASFEVEVPAGWRAIANGALEGVDTLATGRTRWRWRSDRPIPVYTMVVGGGPLTVTPIGAPGGLDHALWTFRQDSAFAVDGPFRRAQRMVEAYTRLIGPFPYAKLAHVQSSTRFGGMENSSAIFYAEGGYASRRMGDGVVAHETAHQWFGDAVTEFDWHHLWLSEGFASYFDPVFFQLAGEEERFRDDMARKKASYLASDVVDRPILDTTVTDLFALLNANNYLKGAWVLHMLRGEVGDSAFFGAVREYYRIFRDSTALTSDFLAVVDRHAGRSLRWFFEQWLLQPGYPQVEVEWAWHRERREVEVRLVQRQPAEWGRFALTVPVLVHLAPGGVARGAARFSGTDPTAVVRLGGIDAEPLDVAVDPDGNLLLTVVSR